MRTILHSLCKSLGVIILLAFFFASPIYSQEVVITEEGDTLVMITPEQVKTINIMFSDHGWLEEKCRLQKERLELQERRIELADSTISRYSQLVSDLEQEMVLRERAHANLVRREKTKAYVIGGVGGIILGTLVTFLLTR